ncbi:MAG: Lrp/AsnC family transcriptional regulator [Candidatus Woesearchaeota archaeon]
MVKLDKKDRKLLYALELNARASELELAKKTLLSREVVRYRLEKLEKQGVIRSYNTIVDTLRLGFLMFRTYYKFTGLTAEKEKELIAFLMARVNWVTKVEGKWNLTTMNFVESIYEYEEFIKELKQEFGQYIQDYWVSTMTKLHHYKRGYLLDGRKGDEDLIMGIGKSEKVREIDALDKKILNIIITNARMKYIDIASKLKVTPKLVKERIKKMIDSKVILGFVTFLDINKLDKAYFKVHFKLKNYSLQKFRSLLQYSLQHPDIVYVVEAVGGDDLEIEVQVDNNQELYKIIRDMQLKFSDVIQDYYFMEYTTEYKFDYLPKRMSA